MHSPTDSNPEFAPTFSRGAKIAAISALTLVSLCTLTLFASVLLTRRHEIVSSAMNPTLYSGEHVTASPLWFSGPPKPGDVSTFWVGSGQRRALYIMRVIAGPGDRVALKEGVVWINGAAVNRQDLGKIDLDAAYGQPHLFRETLPNGASYVVLEEPGEGMFDNMDEITLPADRYFVLGDNRDNASDSRSANVGPVARDDFAGKAVLIHLSFDKTGLRLERIGTWIR